MDSMMPAPTLALLVSLGALLAPTNGKPFVTAAEPRSAATQDVDEGPRPGRWSRRQVPDGWTLQGTRHYQVQSQIGVEAAEGLGRHLEDMLVLYERFLPGARNLDGFVVKLFETREAMLAYGVRTAQGPTVQAWYDAEARELVTYDTGVILGRRDSGTAIDLVSDRVLTMPHADLQRVLTLLDEATVAYTPDTAGLLSHEGWHQYFHAYTVSWVDMPGWLDEGLGDYFASARRVGEGSYRLGELNQARLRDLHRAIEDGRTVHFESLLRFSQAQYYVNAEVYYAQGWSMVHFLMQHPDIDRRRLIPKLIVDFKDSKNFRESTDRVFEGLDMDQLHLEWLQWVMSQEPDDPLRELAREFGEQLQPADLLTDDDWRDVYAWHVRNPNAPTRGTSRLR
jgi:hypothetical protein